MVNQVILVGRLVRTPELQVTDNGKKWSMITLAVNRGYKNQDGEYDTDFLDCSLWTSIAENTAEYCKTGDVIGVKGRLQTRLIENEDGTKHKKMEIIADKVTFLSSARNDKKVSIDDGNAEDNNEDGNGDSEDVPIDVVKESERKYKKKKK
jgi:single-strand DNA-binding protein